MNTSTIHPVDERLPAGRLTAHGLQHVLVMYAGAVAVPLIVGRALKLSPQQVATLRPRDVNPVARPSRYFGIRLPVMMEAAKIAEAH